MRRFMLLLVTLMLIPSVAPRVAMAGPKDEVLALLDKWANAFTQSDVDGIVALYAKDALFLGTQTKGLGVDQAGVPKYFEAALLNNRPRTAKLLNSDVLVVSDTVVLVSGLDELTGVREGVPIKSNGRLTFVVANRGAGWQIVQFHRSPVPN